MRDVAVPFQDGERIALSGKIAPSVHAVMAARAMGALSERCRVFSAEPAGKSPPAKKAFPASAPTIPCVIVSMKPRFLLHVLKD